jgi:hypothetical protein
VVPMVLTLPASVTFAIFLSVSIGDLVTNLV